MAETVASTMTVVRAGQTPSPGLVHGDVCVFQETVTYASQPAADTIVVGQLPKGARFLYGILCATASSGSTTIAIGIAGTPAKYRAAAAFTATDTPTLFGVSANTGVALTADETIIVTLAAATAPSSGTLDIQLYYTMR